MYILSPVFHETIWGGNKLKKYTDREYKQVGHMYVVNGHENMSNTIINGPESGKSLKQVFDKEKEQWNLAEYEEFPLTIALVDAAQNLSIQVHPDDIVAQKLEGKRIGKTESWLFLDAPLSGWIYVGCCYETVEQVAKAVREGEMENITAHLPIKEMDYVCVNAGTLHAMTAGSLVYEIEYGSDYTYRFYDYNRKDEHGQGRELHIEKALESIAPDRKAMSQNISDDCWIQEDNYEICVLNNVDQYENTGKEIECITIVDRNGSAEGFGLYGGIGILLFPGEKLDKLCVEQMIIGRLRR